MRVVDCHWIALNLEAYFCDRLSAEENRLARTHIEHCSACGAEVQSLLNIDPIVKGYFQHELSRASAPHHQRAWLLPAAVAAGLASLLVVAVILQVSESTLRPFPETTAPASDSLEIGTSEVMKDPESSSVLRAKPGIGDQTAQETTSVPVPQEGSVAFLVTDPAGYSRRTEDYRGHILLMGVWSSDRPETIANIERLYRTFGSDARIRVLGVSHERQTKPPGTTFPLAFNQGSTLFGTSPGDFVLLDEAGALRLRGSLLTDSASITNAINTALKDSQ